jgi:hypothetical protein
MRKNIMGSTITGRVSVFITAATALFFVDSPFAGVPEF